MRTTLIVVVGIVVAASCLCCDAKGGEVSQAIVTQSQSDDACLITVELSVPAKEQLTYTTHETVEELPQFNQMLGRIKALTTVETAGHPVLPFLVASVRVPSGRAVEKVEVQSCDADSQEIWADIRLAPAANEPWAEHADAPRPRRIPDREIYGQDAYYPRERVRLGPGIAWRGAEFGTVEVFPFRFNPRQQKLEVSKRVVVRVSFVAAETPARSFLRGNDVFLPLLDIQSGGKFPLPDSAERATGGCNYLAFVPDDERQTVLSQFLKKKEQEQGLVTRMVLLSDLRNTDETLTADELRTRIRTRIEEECKRVPSPDYLLLVGDAEDIPPYAGVLHPWWGYSGTLRRVATDLYYATMDGPDDLEPDLLMGRLPARNAAELRIMVEKIVHYQQSQHQATGAADWGQVLVAGEYQNSKYFKRSTQQDVSVADRWFLQTANDVVAFLREIRHPVQTAFVADYPGLLSLDRYFYDVVTAVPHDVEFLDPGVARTKVIDQWGKNSRLVVHRDHGSYDGWGTPSFRRADVDELTLGAGAVAPVVFSLNCETGCFDYPNEQCFAERLMRDSEGATAVVGATRVSYSGYNDRLTEGLLAGLWPKFQLSFDPNTPRLEAVPMVPLGVLVPLGTQNMRKYYPTGERTKLQCELFHLFGDPAMLMRTDLQGG